MTELEIIQEAYKLIKEDRNRLIDKLLPEKWKQLFKDEDFIQRAKDKLKGK